MTSLKKLSHGCTTTSYNSVYLNPLTDDKENAPPRPPSQAAASKEVKSLPKPQNQQQQQQISAVIKDAQKQKPRSLQLRLRDTELAGAVAGSMSSGPHSTSSDVWDFSDSEAAPASSWSTLPNRSLLCRPLPVDVGRCTCIIAKESINGASFYSLYTNEGHGRQDRKLAVARHRRRNGRSEFVVAQHQKSIFCNSNEDFLGTITANFMGSKYQIWDQGNPLDYTKKESQRLLGFVEFVPTITTLAGSFRSMRAWIPKHQSVQLKNTATTKIISQIQHIGGLPKDWKEKKTKVHQLQSKIPCYNPATKRYELDFRERAGNNGSRIRRSAKNFQLSIEDKGRQTTLQMGKIGRSQYLMDYRYPLTGYQAFCICLASIDSKLCCSV